MTSHEKAKRDLNEFKSLLREAGKSQGFRCRVLPGFRDNTIELTDAINCLIHIKVSTGTHFWGIGPQSIDEFNNSSKNWMIVLLDESSETGYLLTRSDVANYSYNWSHATEKSSDYKIQPEDFEYRGAFHSFDKFIELLKKNNGGKI